MGSSPHLCKTSRLTPELQVSMGSRPHLSFVHANSVPRIRNTSLYGYQPSSVVFGCKTGTLGLEQKVSMCPRHHLSFCASKTAWLAPQPLVSMGPNPYLWFLHVKQRLLEQNYKSLCVPDLTCHFVHAKLSN